MEQIGIVESNVKEEDFGRMKRGSLPIGRLGGRRKFKVIEA